MKVALFTDQKHIPELTTMIAQYPTLIPVSEDPDVVISYGGDGTYLRSEYAWPSIPKVVLKASTICKLCEPFSNEDILDALSHNTYVIKELPLICATAQKKQLTAVNDIIVHNEDPRHAIRYTIAIDGVPLHEKDIIGDGIVVATPLGSTGYYRSITDSSFSIGLGLAFNNSTEQFDHMVLPEDTVITMTIVRGPALIYADNQKEYIVLNEKEHVTIQRSPKKTRLLRMKSYNNHPRL